MTGERIETIRAAEAYSHTEAYRNLRLFEPGSWLAKPVRTVMELIPHFSDCSDFQGLDLGCGIGRNCIPVLQELSHVPSRMDCVDILPLAVEKLMENGKKYGVADRINGIVCPVDHYYIRENGYNLILGLSVLEHLESTEILEQKLLEIWAGLRPGGIACFVINTSVEEHDQESGKSLDVQFEINLSADEIEILLDRTFSEAEILKKTRIHYQYDTYRESGTVRLDTDVLTYVARKRN